jgi:hypothetical protein
MNLQKMKPTDQKTNRLIYSSPAGPAFDSSISKTEDTALHPTFGRKEKPPGRTFPEDEDFREYYRLRSPRCAAGVRRLIN